LLKEALHSEQATLQATTSKDATPEQMTKLIQDLQNMFDFLARECFVDWKLYTDNLRRSPKQVAALHGDVVLLTFLVEYSNKHKNPAMGCLKILPHDEFDCTPLHYMAQKGHA
jgi:hypothetical protein